MKRFLFIATLVTMAANAWAYEYTFNFAQNYASRTVSGTTVKFTMPDNNGNPLITFEVITDANIVAGMDARAALANQNVAGQHELPVRALGAKALGVAVTAVTRRTHSLFMGENLQIHLEHVLTSVP